MNRRTLTASVIATALLLGLGAFAGEQVEKKAEPKKQINCPVMKRQPIDKNKYIDVNGKRIYVCCSGCLNQIKANPDEYIKQMEAEGIVLDETPKKEKHEGDKD